MTKKLTFGSLFAGIGGFDLGFERAGMECKWQVEIDSDAREWLKNRWPKATQFYDVRKFHGSFADVICGGFPCQNLSSANVKTRNGLSGDKSGLWSEFCRVVATVLPTWAVAENVDEWRDWVPQVRRDLWRIGYSSLPIRLCASQFGAFHRRPRVFVVANSDREGKSLGTINAKVASLLPATTPGGNGFKDPRRFISRNDGLPRWMARAYGNAVVPQVAEWIGRRIVEATANQHSDAYVSFIERGDPKCQKDDWER